EHLLLAMLLDEQGQGVFLLNRAEVPVPALRQRLEQELKKRPRVTGGAADQVTLTGRMSRLLDRAEGEAKKAKEEKLSVAHILLALLEASGAWQFLKEAGLTREALERAQQFEALERYGRDLTQLAAQGKLDPVIGRDDEIRRVIQVLSRRTKN